MNERFVTNKTRDIIFFDKDLLKSSENKHFVKDFTMRAGTQNIFLAKKIEHVEGVYLKFTVCMNE